MSKPEPLRDPRYIALQYELRELRDLMKQAFSFENSDLNLYSKSKAAAFTDTDVPCQGANLIQVSTDGNLSNVSYKIVQLDGRNSMSIEALESPHIIGPITAIKLTNDTAEAGKTVRVARYRIPAVALPAIRRGAHTSKLVPFTAIFTQDVDEATPTLETDKSKTDTPTQYLTADLEWMTRGIIHEIDYRLNPTNAVTYTLMVFEAAKDDDYESNSRLLYESAAARADDTDYPVSDLEIPFKLDTAGRIYIATDWTAAAGNTKGYIRISGVGVKT